MTKKVGKQNQLVASEKKSTRFTRNRVVETPKSAEPMQEKAKSTKSRSSSQASRNQQAGQESGAKPGDKVADAASASSIKGTERTTIDLERSSSKKSDKQLEQVNVCNLVMPPKQARSKTIHRQVIQTKLERHQVEKLPPKEASS